MYVVADSPPSKHSYFGRSFNMLVCLVTVILVHVHIQQVHLKAAKSSV